MFNDLGKLLILATPALAIVGGIVTVLVRLIGQQRLIELAQRERIAAIERGLDLSLLPPLPVSGPSPRQLTLRRIQGLTIGGLVTLAFGIGLGVMLVLLPDHEAREAWPVGFVPLFLGIALLVAARAVRAGLDRDAA